jgi:hypothetical protein
MPYYDEIRRCLSPGRFEGYRRSLRDTDDDLLARHLWNLTLAEALYPSLNTFEISLRNSIHETLVAATGAADWYVAGRQSAFVLAEREQEWVNGAIRAATTRLLRSGKSLTHGHIVAELSFGFWVTLFDRRYDVQLRPYLASMFPCLRAHDRTRKHIARRLEKIRLLRNRIFHHEPIWSRSDLLNVHGEILETISGKPCHGRDGHEY